MHIMQGSQPLVVHDISNPPIGEKSIAAPKILVVEDHEIGLEIICMMLGRLGVSTAKAANGFEAINMVNAASAANAMYSLLLVDFAMPEMGGIETTRKLRSLGYSPKQLPILAITASIDTDEIQSFMDAGGQAFLTKPIKSAELSNAISGWLPSGLAEKMTPAGWMDQPLYERYYARKIAVLEMIDAMIAAPDVDAQSAEEAANMLHNLAGTAGVFGDDALSFAAARCEVALRLAQRDEVHDILRKYRKAFTDEF
jgi:CheY-like chemotaxis protein